MTALARRRYLLETVVGLVMIPLTFLPIFLYLSRNDAGYLMYLRARYNLFPPSTQRLAEEERLAAASERVHAVKGVPVLVYHGIGRSPAGPEAEFVVSRERFAEQLGALAEAGYEAITTRELAAYLRTRDERRLPEKPVLLTFDDGRSDAMIQADRVLADTGLRATMFVITRAPTRGSFYYEGWKRLRAYAASGRWELANHTHDLHALHDTGSSEPVGALVDPEEGETLAEYGGRVGADLDRAQAALAARAGLRPLAFAYPFGDWGARAGTAVAAALRRELERRFAVAFDQDGQESWRPVLPGDDPYHLRRLQVDGAWSGPELVRRLGEGARRSAAVHAERALGYRFDDAELAAAADRQTCASPAPAPIRGRDDLAGARLVAFTFDGGPSPATAELLDRLRAHGAAATFFVRGARVSGRENLLRRMLVEGHELANGGFSGTDLRLLSRGGVREELRRTREAVKGAAGVPTCALRPPFGHGSDRVAGIARSLGLSTVLWSVDPSDYAVEQSALIARRVERSVRSGSVVVLHDGGGDRSATVAAVERLLTSLSRRGYRFVTVQELLAYRSRPACALGGAASRPAWLSRAAACRPALERRPARLRARAGSGRAGADTGRAVGPQTRVRGTTAAAADRRAGAKRRSAAARPRAAAPARRARPRRPGRPAQPQPPAVATAPSPPPPAPALAALPPPPAPAAVVQPAPPAPPRSPQAPPKPPPPPPPAPPPPPPPAPPPPTASGNGNGPPLTPPGQEKTPPGQQDGGGGKGKG